MLHHVFWLSVFAAYSLLHVTLVCPGVPGGGFLCSHRGFSYTRRSYVDRIECGAFRVRNVNFRAHDAPTSITSTTDQCGAFRVHSVYFHAHDAPTSLASTTDQCGACSGSPQLNYQKACFNSYADIINLAGLVTLNMQA